MASDQTTLRLFEKFDEVINNQADIRERLTRVETKQDAHYTENDNAHNNMASAIVSAKEDLSEEMQTVVKRVADLEEGQDEQESIEDQRKGVRKILNKSWEVIIAFIGGGALIALGGWLAKLMGILR